MKKKLFKTGVLVLLSGLILLSCKDKDKDKEIDRDSNTTLDNANSQSVFDDAFKLSEEVLKSNSPAKVSAEGSVITCVSAVDVQNKGENHNVYTITFDPTCWSYDNKARSGQLVVDLNGASYNTAGAVLTITSNGYKVNGVEVIGKKTVSCVKSGTHDIVVSDVAGSGFGKIRYPDGKVASWRTFRTRTLVSGGDTPALSDNVYDISTTPNKGNPAAQGVNVDGRNYVVNINTPIRIDFNCFTSNTARYPTQGILELVPEGKIARSVNYGSGTCDNAVVVTVGTFSFDVNLSY